MTPIPPRTRASCWTSLGALTAWALCSACSEKPRDASSGSGGSSGAAVAGGSGGTTATSGGAGSSTGGAATGGETATIPAFPGAEGAGKFSRGGRGGSVCHVTTLADSGPGSLRQCVVGHGRTVVFDVGGWITLTSPLSISSHGITLAGQTAPGGGIGVRGQHVTVSGTNIVIRFMRFRRGTIISGAKADSLDILAGTDNAIIDHCSVGFGIDENLSMPGDEPIGPLRLTVQWTINAYALQLSNHSAGSLLMAHDTSIHHTLWALNKTRNPRARTVAGTVLDWVNNVVYGWNAAHPYGVEQGWSLSSDPFMMANSGTGTHTANAVGNVFIGAQAAEYAFVAGENNAEGVPAFSLYFEDNLLDGNANGRFDVSKDDFDMVEQPATRLEQRLPAAEVTTDPADVAYERVLLGVGATLPERDEVDRLLIEQVQNQTGELITSELDLVLLGVSNDGYGTLAEGVAPTDSDGDGMPDAWESQQGFDPADASDGNGDANGDGYTNLEEYLNSLVPPNPTAP